MLFSKVTDNKIRQKLLKFEYKNRIKKFILINALNNVTKKNKNFSRTETLYKSLYFSLDTKKSCFKGKIVKHCLLNNRTKSVYNKFNLSRSILRELMLFGVIPGYKKAVW
jgi:ribosomal protein S14